MKSFKKNLIIAFAFILINFALGGCIRYHYNSNVDLGKYLSKLISELYTTDNANSRIEDSISSQSNISNDLVVSTPVDKITNLTGKVETLSKYTLPELNEILYGFRVNGIYDFKERNAKLVVFEHKKTGAIVYLISNDDIDKCACLGFNTLTNDDRGIPHVFEHAVLAGSEKYHGSNLFFDMTSKTYTTYLNAFTSQFNTCYPIGSLSDEQLFSCYKMYIDGVLKPDILKDERILERDGYRYILSNKDDDLQLSGVVYSEMSAYENNIIAKAMLNTNKTLFKNSFLSSETGGLPSEIPKISQNDLIEFHNVYYHPSNMVITLYGDLDYRKYLEYTNNEYFANYDKKAINKEDKNYQKNNGFTERSFEFPVASDSSIDNGSIIVYSILCDGMSAYETGVFSLIINELQRDEGPLSKEVSNKLYKAMYNVYDDLASPKPSIKIMFQNVNADDKELIKIIVENALNEIVKNGIDEELLNSFIDNNDMSNELTRDSHGFTDEIGSLYNYAFMDYGKSKLCYLEYMKGISDLKDRYLDGTINNLIKKYLSTNENSALTITYPKAGLLEKTNNENKDKLKKYKNSLSDDEINDLIEKNKEYDKWVEVNNSRSDIDKIRIASASTLPEYRASCYAYEENIEGIRFIRSDIDDINYSIYDIMFDASGVSFNDILKLKLISNLFLSLPTENYPDFALKAEFDKYAYSYGSSLYVNHYWNGGYNPYFMFSVMTLNKNLDKTFELLQELMFKTEFNDINKFRNFINQEYHECISDIQSNPSIISNDLMNCIIDPDYEYDKYISGLPYIKFLKEIIKYNDDELKDFLSECNEFIYNFYNTDNMVCEIISDFDYIANIKKNILNLVKNIKNEKIIPINYSDFFSESNVNTAIALNTSVQYNYIGLPYKDNDLEFDAKYYIIDSIVNNKILYPEFRVKRSSYGSYVFTTRKGSYIYTYRDPELKITYDVFKEIPNILKNIKISEDEFEDYKISAYANFSYPLTKLGAATIAIDEILQKCNEKRPERFLKYMKQIKNAQLSDFNELKKRFTIIIEKGVKVSVGSKEQIDSAKEIFNDIIYDYLD